MFISTDITGPLSANMYAYCENNPVNNSDPNGELSITLAAALIGGVVGAVSQVATNAMFGKKLSDGVLGAATGGFFGGLTILAGPVVSGYVAAFAESAVNEVASYKKEDKKLTAQNIGKSALKVAGTTLVNGSINAVAGKAVKGIFNPELYSYGTGSLIFGKIARKMWTQATAQAATILGERIMFSAVTSPGLSESIGIV